MAVGDFDTYYSDNPWEVVDKNQRTWYDPELITLFRQRSLFTPTIQFTKNLESVKATKMVMTQLLEPHPDYTALALRQIWMPASHVDSRNVEIVFQRQGGKVAYHKYDDMITYWQQNGNAGLRRIMRGALGGHMVDVLDLLSRNAYLSGSLTSGYAIYEGGGTDFSAIGTSDIFSLGQALDIWLGMSLRGVASALGVAGAANNIICYTSPSVIYDIQKGTGSDEWIAVNQYEGRVQALRNEVGTYKNVRFVQSPRLVLWNAGEVIAQTTITAAVTAGDGAPDPSSTKVDGTYLVGQETGGITNSIPYNDTFITGNRWRGLRRRHSPGAAHHLHRHHSEHHHAGQARYARLRHRSGCRSLRVHHQRPQYPRLHLCWWASGYRFRYRTASSCAYTASGR
jgi:hypothetical protein